MDKITIFHKGNLVFLNPKEILFFQAESNYTSILMVSGEKYLVSKCLKCYSPVKQYYNYKRIHSKFLVNMDYAKMISKKNRILTLKIGGLSLPISRARMKSVMCL